LTALRHAVLKRVAGNTGWNVLGQFLPLVAGIAAIPFLIDRIGLERFGFLSLAWVLIGYASVFDFGVAKALIRIVSARLAAGDRRAAEDIARSGWLLLLGFGVLVATLVALSANWLVDAAFKLEGALAAEASLALMLLAVSLPFVMLTAGYVAVLSAFEHFRSLNVLRIVLGAGSFLLPTWVALYDTSLPAVVGAVVGLRVAGAVAYRVQCATLCALVLAQPKWSVKEGRELVTLGGWLAVSNIVGPLMTYLDRLLLAALVPLREVAFYATPFDVLSKLMILPHAAMAALFPRTASVTPGTAAAVNLLDGSMRVLWTTMFPVLYVLAALSGPLFTVWLGADFARKAAPVAQMLAVGMLFNAVAQAPATLVQAAGQPRWLAQLHLIELPIFLALLWWLTTRWGILGTAVAAAIRPAADAVAVYVLAVRGPARGHRLSRRVLPSVATAAALVAALPLISDLATAVVLGLLGSVVFILLTWLTMFDPHERARFASLIPARP
jgi:O-antigen/teichoic acid export membrane protein